MKKFQICLMIIWAIFPVLQGCGGPQDGGDSDNIPESGNSENSDDSQEENSGGDSGSTADDDTPADSGSTEGEDPVSDSAATENTGTLRLTVDLVSTASPSSVYAIWAENKARTFVQNLYICNRILNGSLTGTALPYWIMNKKSSSSLDGVTGATILPEFSITRTLSKELGNEFTVYVEADHSFDGNDWFNDQPALLFAADVNLGNLQAEYQLNFVGWTKASQNSYSNAAGAPTTGNGKLNTELRYITHHAENGGFGSEDDRSSVTRVVDSLKATVK